MWALLAVVFLVSSTAVESYTENLIWQEEFNELDTTTWNHMVTAWRGGNWEFQYYRNNRTNSYVTDGILYIKPSFTADQYGESFLSTGFVDLTKEGCNEPLDNGCLLEPNSYGEIIQPIQSARIRTIDSFHFKYGRIEVKAKLPQGDWLWPAIWLLPSGNVYGDWPASGEIDMVEARGNRNLYDSSGTSQGIDLFSSTLHWGPVNDDDTYYLTHWENRGTNWGEDFHIYSMEWMPSYFTFSVDGSEYGYFDIPTEGFWQYGGFSGTNVWTDGQYNAPFDQEFFFILNIAVGGTFFSDDWTNSPNPIPWTMGSATSMKEFWDNKDYWYSTWNVGTDDSAMQVDYIRYYEFIAG